MELLNNLIQSEARPRLTRTIYVKLCFQTRQSLFEAMDFLFMGSILLVEFLDLIQKHGIQEFVLNSLNLPVSRVCHEVRINFGNLLGDQHVLKRLGPIRERLLIVKCHGPKPQ